jgi:hypothetical protein
VVGLLVAVVFTVTALVPERTAERPRSSPLRQAPSTSTALPSPTARSDLSALAIRREPFCGRLDERYATAALGGHVGARTSYRPGDRMSLAPDVTDVAHEFGCVFRSGDAEARAWVFTAPMDAAEASALVEEASAEGGCRVPDDTLRYGMPGVVTVCPLPDGRVQVTGRGLYGDAWLSCQLMVAADPEEALPRAENWCLHVATALVARP